MYRNYEKGFHSRGSRAHLSRSQCVCKETLSPRFYQGRLILDKKRKYKREDRTFSFSGEKDVAVKAR